MKYDLKADIIANPELVAKIKARDDYAQNLYAAMCNMCWQRSETFPILRNDIWSVGWRGAGGVIADIRGEGDYLSWYCSGIYGGGWRNDDVTPEYVAEGIVTLEVLRDLRELGWHPMPWEN